MFSRTKKAEDTEPAQPQLDYQQVELPGDIPDGEAMPYMIERNTTMGKLIKRDNSLPSLPERQPDKTETYAGKHTARVTKVYNNADGSQYRATRKINKDGSITDKLEHRHN